MSGIVRSYPIRIYHRLLRYSPDYLATRCKPVRNRLGKFIGRSCVGLWKTAMRYIGLPRRRVCGRERHWKLFPSFLTCYPVGTSREDESAGATNRRTDTVKSSSTLRFDSRSSSSCFHIIEFRRFQFYLRRSEYNP